MSDDEWGGYSSDGAYEDDDYDDYDDYDGGDDDYDVGDDGYDDGGDAPEEEYAEDAPEEEYVEDAPEEEYVEDNSEGSGPQKENEEGLDSASTMSEGVSAHDAAKGDGYDSRGDDGWGSATVGREGGSPVGRASQSRGGGVIGYGGHASDGGWGQRRDTPVDNGWGRPNSPPRNSGWGRPNRPSDGGWGQPHDTSADDGWGRATHNHDARTYPSYTDQYTSRNQPPQERYYDHEREYEHSHPRYYHDSREGSWDNAGAHTQPRSNENFPAERDVRITAHGPGDREGRARHDTSNRTWSADARGFIQEYHNPQHRAPSGSAEREYPRTRFQWPSEAELAVPEEHHGGTRIDTAAQPRWEYHESEEGPSCGIPLVDVHEHTQAIDAHEHTQALSEHERDTNTAKGIPTPTEACSVKNESLTAGSAVADAKSSGSALDSHHSGACDEDWDEDNCRNATSANNGLGEQEADSEEEQSLEEYLAQKDLGYSWTPPVISAESSRGTQPHAATIAHRGAALDLCPDDEVLHQSDDEVSASDEFIVLPPRSQHSLSSSYGVCSFTSRDVPLCDTESLVTNSSPFEFSDTESELGAGLSDSDVRAPTPRPPRLSRSASSSSGSWIAGWSYPAPQPTVHRDPIIESPTERTPRKNRFATRLITATSAPQSAEHTGSMVKVTSKAPSIMCLSDATESIASFFNDPSYILDSSNKLRLWQSLCIEFGLVSLPAPESSLHSAASLAPLPTSLTQARRLLKAHAHVNLVEYMAARTDRTRYAPGTDASGRFADLLYPSARSMVRAARRDRKFLRLTDARKEWLDPLLRSFGFRARRASAPV